MNERNQHLQRVNVHELQEKFRSKKELYTFLTQDCKAFLPTLNSTNVYFFKQILRSQKDYIPRDKVKVGSAPHIEGLTVTDFLNYAKRKPDLLRYLPDEKDWVHLDRQWIISVLYTQDPGGIQDMINEALKERKGRLEESQNLIVEMRPEFKKALEECLNFSSTKGRSIFLMKPSSKRKRTREEALADKEEEKQLNTDKHQYFQKAKRLKDDNQNLQDELMIYKNDHEIVQSLISQGFIDDFGDLQQQQQLLQR